MRSPVSVALLLVLCAFAPVVHAEPAVHTCAQTTLIMSETAGTFTIPVQRGGDLTQATTASVQLFGWSDLEYLSGTYNVPFAPGETHNSLNLPFIDDALFSGPRSITALCQTAGSPPGPSYTRVTIIDDEPVPTVVIGGDPDFTESDVAQVVSFPISFVPALAPSYTEGVHVWIDHDTTDDHDVEVVTWSQERIDLRIKGDDAAEPDEKLSVVVVSYPDTLPAIRRNIPVTIRDDDRPPFPYTFGHDGYVVDEANGGPITIRRGGDLSASVDLLLKAHAIEGPGWGSSTPVVFAPGEAAKDAYLEVEDDWYTGPRAGTLELQLAGWVGASVELLVIDDETRPSLSIGDARGAEGNLDHTTLSVPLTLSAPVGEALHIAVTASHGTTNAQDVVLKAQTVTIPVGAVTASAVFDVTGDFVTEEDETFTVTMGCCTGLATPGRTSATATIVNDDGPAPAITYRLAFTQVVVGEANKWLRIPVRRSGRLDAATHATLTVSSSDYRTFKPREVSFAPNEVEKVVPFFIDDAAYSGTATLTVELFDGTSLLGRAVATVYDNESWPMAGIRAARAREGDPAGGALFRVFVSPPSAKPVSIDLRANSATAMVGLDLSRFSATVNLAPFAGFVDVLVPVEDDEDAENLESFDLEIVSVRGAAKSTTASVAEGLIDDNDSPHVRNEPMVLRDTLTTITVELGHAAPEDDLVRFIASSNALEGPAIIPIPKGESRVSFQVRARGEGSASFSIEPPAFLDFTPLTGTFTIYEVSRVTISPTVLDLEPGFFAPVLLSIAPHAVPVTAVSSDPSVAAVEVTMAGGNPSLVVYGASPGRAEIVVTLPASAGGTTVRMPVLVGGEPLSRKRVVRH